MLPRTVDFSQPYTKLWVKTHTQLSKYPSIPPGNYVWPGKSDTLFLSLADKEILAKQIIVCEYIDAAEPEVVQLPDTYVQPVKTTTIVTGLDTQLTADITDAPAPNLLMTDADLPLGDHDPIVIEDDASTDLADGTAGRNVGHDQNSSDSDPGVQANSHV